MSLPAPSALPLLQLCDVKVKYPARRRSAPAVLALDNVSFSLAAGETLAIVGESGSGKSSLLRAVLRLLKPDAGQVLFQGHDLALLTPAQLRQRRRQMALVFQDPIASLDPKMSVRSLIAEPLLDQSRVPSPEALAERVRAQMLSVGLDESLADRRAHQLSGGQAQRVALARALIASPRLLICDEPVSALDLSLRAQVLDLIIRERAQQGFALLFVTHDLAAARYLCDRLLVLKSGKIVEAGATASIFSTPQHPYTQSLLNARLSVQTRRRG